MRTKIKWNVQVHYKHDNETERQIICTDIIQHMIDRENI